MFKFNKIFSEFSFGISRIRLVNFFKFLSLDESNK